MLLVPTDISSSAIFSGDNKYRLSLQRWWGGHPYKCIMFLMMNPSTATETIDDPTVRKCRKYANAWGYNYLIITNVMAYRATNPKELLNVYDPVGEGNVKHIQYLLNNHSPFLVCAWGKIPPKLSYAEDDIMRIIKPHSPHILRLNKAGRPWHPLYLPDATIPEPWII